VKSSKDLAVRLRFDRFPPLDPFRRRFALVGIAAVILGVAIWAATQLGIGSRQYLPGPVTPNHATFGDRCETCHDSFANAPDSRCLACHPSEVRVAELPDVGRVAFAHSQFATTEDACATCHLEHLGDSGLRDVPDVACVRCHGDLEARPGAPEIAKRLTSFASHPEFGALRPGQADPAKLRFNHHVHLTTDRITNEKLECASCHRLDARGHLMQPIEFERDCRRCHAQEVTGPIAAIEVPHESPETIRRFLDEKLLALGAEEADQIFGERNTFLPGRSDRGPIDESRTLRDFRNTWVGRVEKELYAPFVDQKPLLESNKFCFLCHLSERPLEGETLPVVAKTDIPTRWLGHARFGHLRHAKVACEQCHAGIRESADTAQVNLPGKALCESCHVADSMRSAGTNCVLCHAYHASRKPGAEEIAARTLPLPALLGFEPPPPEAVPSPPNF
jgi:hypothetical protein